MITEPVINTTKHQCTPGAPPPEPEHLPCPRCDSTNTKFCYYNNYNFSQPRHFCKGCRRYWTHGGTLRDIPVGGGSRKNAKRSRLTTSGGVSTSSLEFRRMVPQATTSANTPMLLPFGGDHLCYGKPSVSMCESFTSLLNSTSGPGFFGFEDGFGRPVWPFSGVGGGYGGGSTWQLESGEGVGLPDLAISTPGMM